MADFVKDSINKAQNTPQEITQKEAKQLQSELGTDVFQKMIEENLIAIKNSLTKSDKEQDKEKNKKEQDRIKSEQRHQQTIATLRSFSGDIKATMNSLIISTANKIGDVIGQIAPLAQVAYEAARVGVKLSFIIDKMQTQRNIEYLRSHSLSSVYDQNFAAKANQSYNRMLNRAADYGISGEEMKALNQQLYSSMNIRRIDETTRENMLSGLYSLGNKGFVAAAGPEFAEVYKTMLAHGGTVSGALANLGVFNKAFTNNSLGTERSLQMSKQLYDASRRLGMSFNSAAGYIQKYNKELQDGTSTLQDITSVRTTLRTKGTGDLAGLGQMMVNMGFGTQEMINASGNPMALASLIRKGDARTINALQDTFNAIATGAGFGKGTKGRDEYLRNLYGLYGFSLNEDLLKRVTAGNYISAYDLGIKQKQGETPEQAKAREQKEFIDLITTASTKVVAAQDTYEAKMLAQVEKIASVLGETQETLSKPGALGNQVGGALYDMIHNGKIKESISISKLLENLQGLSKDSTNAVLNVLTKMHLINNE